MEETLSRELGPQPIVELLERYELTHRAVVEASPKPISFKLIARACSGRRLTIHSKQLVLEAVNAALGGGLHMTDLFNY